MKPVIFSAKAEDDLEEIADHIAEDSDQTIYLPDLPLKGILKAFP